MGTGFGMGGRDKVLDIIWDGVGIRLWDRFRDKVWSWFGTRYGTGSGRWGLGAVKGLFFLIQFRILHFFWGGIFFLGFSVHFKRFLSTFSGEGSVDAWRTVAGEGCPNGTAGFATATCAATGTPADCIVLGVG